ncbi:MAG TPA: fumarylacetoacetate hydrolase family protein [Dehalococcoidia bacterium]|nr:fumarylacetoacetate hydrolase family protein [Dehalococcoidia bacterium]
MTVRLVTYRAGDQRRTGAMLDDHRLVDLARATDGALPADMLQLLALGEDGLARARHALAGAPPAAVVVLDADLVRLDAPVPRPGKALAIGLNYRDHAAEGGQPLPQRPIVFSKVSTCITGPGMPVQVPRASEAVDYEGELCFVIGRRGRHITAADALEYVAGYTIGNDVSVRDWQSHNPTWMMGKGFDTHGPIGPWIVTRDDIPDPHALGIKTYLNGELVQSSNTKHLIFGIPALIEYISTAFTLEPGDVVFTGTPAGVGVSRKPPLFMKPGDTVRVEVERIGALENPVVAEP